MRFLLFLTCARGALALTCQQIQKSQMFDGSDFYVPGPDSKPVVLPPNFECTYTIPVDVDLKGIMYARVGITNHLKGRNDFITVVDSFGVRKTLDSKSQSFIEYEVFPDHPMTISVITRSVLSNSAFSIHVQYKDTKVGAEQQLVPNSINFFDLAKIGSSGGRSNSVQYTSGGPQMTVSLAIDPKNYPHDYLDRVYLIDGTFYDQINVTKLSNLVHNQHFVTLSYDLTIVTFENRSISDVAVVVNFADDVAGLDNLSAGLSVQQHETSVKVKPVDGGNANAVEVVTLLGKQITVAGVFFDKPPASDCVAEVVAGVPGNSSQVLFDLVKNGNQLPKTFDTNNLSVIGVNCGFKFDFVTPFV